MDETVTMICVVTDFRIRSTKFSDSATIMSEYRVMSRCLNCTTVRMGYILAGRKASKSIPFEKSLYAANVIETRPSYTEISDAERQTRALHGSSFHGVCVKKKQ